MYREFTGVSFGSQVPSRARKLGFDSSRLSLCSVLLTPITCDVLISVSPLLSRTVQSPIQRGFSEQTAQSTWSEKVF